MTTPARGGIAQADRCWRWAHGDCGSMWTAVTVTQEGETRWVTKHCDDHKPAGEAVLTTSPRRLEVSR